MAEDWRQIARTFHERADEYDRWFQDSPVFASELAALKALGPLPAPACEIGTGPGRFSAALGLALGIDPAWAPLLKAQKRALLVMQARGEHLPLRDVSLGAAALIMTLCFTEEPCRVLRECARVLRPDGLLLLGMVPAEGPWGRILVDKGAQGHPYYRHARILRSDEILTLLRDTGFQPRDCVSTLLQSPDTLHAEEAPVPGLREQAGFIALTAVKTSANA